MKLWRKRFHNVSLAFHWPKDTSENNSKIAILTCYQTLSDLDYKFSDKALNSDWLFPYIGKELSLKGYDLKSFKNNKKSIYLSTDNRTMFFFLLELATSFAYKCRLKHPISCFSNVWVVLIRYNCHNIHHAWASRSRW